MNKIKLLDEINKYSFDGEDEKIIDLLNDLFDNGEYKACLNLVFNAISTTQMYGFLAYLTEEEQKFFYNGISLGAVLIAVRKLSFTIVDNYHYCLTLSIIIKFFYRHQHLLEKQA